LSSGVNLEGKGKHWLLAVIRKPVAAQDASMAVTGLFFQPGFEEGRRRMSGQVIIPSVGSRTSAAALGSPAPRKHRHPGPPSPFRFPAQVPDGDIAQRQAELFYLQKQIQSQTPMVIVLEDGELVEGQIEWYDRNTLKVRGRAKTLIFKSAIKYMYKLGEGGQ
jgi:sRNA-binding regulator protein Hfq